MSSDGCGKPLRETVYSGEEMVGNAKQPRAVGVLLDSGCCGDPSPAGAGHPPRFCSFDCFARWSRPQRARRARQVTAP